jgi:hypothetical protein
VHGGVAVPWAIQTPREFARDGCMQQVHAQQQQQVQKQVVAIITRSSPFMRLGASLKQTFSQAQGIICTLVRLSSGEMRSTQFGQAILQRR